MISISSLVIYSLFISNHVFANFQPEFAPNDDFVILRFLEGPSNPPGTILHTFKANDPDRDTITFNIVGDTETQKTFTLVKIGRSEAGLLLNVELDREVTPQFIMDVTLTDGRTVKPATQSVMVIVMDINDNSPTFEKFISTVKVPENGDAPTEILTLSAHDADEGTNGELAFTMSIDHNVYNIDLETFKMTVGEDDNSVTIELLRPLDYEANPFYKLGITAMDNPDNESLSRETSVNVKILVEDQDDNGPLFVSLPKPVTVISEDASPGTKVCEVIATDGDSGIDNPIIYELINKAENDLFELDETTGEIRPTMGLERKRGLHTLRVRASEWNNDTEKSDKFIETNVYLKVEEKAKSKPTSGTKNSSVALVSVSEAENKKSSECDNLGFVSAGIITAVVSPGDSSGTDVADLGIMEFYAEGTTFSIEPPIELYTDTKEKFGNEVLAKLGPLPFLVHSKSGILSVNFDVTEKLVSNYFMIKIRVDSDLKSTEDATLKQVKIFVISRNESVKLETSQSPETMMIEKGNLEQELGHIFGLNAIIRVNQSESTNSKVANGALLQLHLVCPKTNVFLTESELSVLQHETETQTELQNILDNYKLSKFTNKHIGQSDEVNGNKFTKFFESAETPSANASLRVVWTYLLLAFVGLILYLILAIIGLRWAHAWRNQRIKEEKRNEMKVFMKRGKPTFCDVLEVGEESEFRKMPIYLMDHFENLDDDGNEKMKESEC